jgi:hypothetical protein
MLGLLVLMWLPLQLQSKSLEGIQAATYKDPHRFFSFSYPKGWMKQEEQGSHHTPNVDNRTIFTTADHVNH